MVYLWYSLNNIADATLYYDVAKRGDYSFAPGTEFINFFTAIFVDYIDLSYLGAFLLFNIIGSLGLLAFDGVLRVATDGKARHWRLLATIVIFLPSVSYWSSAIGKDAISFMATCVALWASLNLVHRYPWMVFSIVAMFLVRPHMAGLLVLSVIISVVLELKSSIFMKVFVVLVCAGAAVVLTPFALNYVGATDTSTSGLTEYIEQREGYNMEGGGAIDISTMSLPVKMMTYLFRPFPFEAKSVLQFAASVDNMVLILVCIMGLYQILRRFSGGRLARNYFALIYSMAALFILSITTANLGISVRQKWMFVPMLVFLMLSAARANPRRIG